MRTRNPRLNRFAPRVCGDEDSTLHTDRSSTRDGEHGKPAESLQTSE